MTGCRFYVTSAEWSDSLPLCPGGKIHARPQVHKTAAYRTGLVPLFVKNIKSGTTTNNITPNYTQTYFATKTRHRLNKLWKSLDQNDLQNNKAGLTLVGGNSANLWKLHLTNETIGSDSGFDSGTVSNFRITKVSSPRRAFWSFRIWENQKWYDAAAFRIMKLARKITWPHALNGSHQIFHKIIKQQIK